MMRDWGNLEKGRKL